MPAPRRYCGARSKRHGGRCKLSPARGRTRCRLHGGASPGGYRGSIMPARRAYLAKKALMLALGLKWYGGAPRKPRRVASLQESALQHIKAEIVEFEERLPGLRERSLDTLTGPELAGRAALSGLRALVEIIETPLERDANGQFVDMRAMKTARLVGDMAVAANKLLERRARDERNDDVLGKLLAVLEAEKQKTSSD